MDNKTKARFFALYFGQNVAACVYNPEQADNPVPERIVYDEDLRYITYLQLKPLSPLSDEDAIEVGTLQIGSMHPVKADWARAWIKEALELNEWKIEVIDFLRSRGYLLPFMGLSCEEIIEAGWAKYVEA